MSCTICASDMLKDFDGELGIHFPGREGLDKALVLVYPKLRTCLNCGHVEFFLPAAQKEELKRNFTAPGGSVCRDGDRSLEQPL